MSQRRNLNRNWRLIKLNDMENMTYKNWQAIAKATL